LNLVAGRFGPGFVVVVVLPILLLGLWILFVLLVPPAVNCVATLAHPFPPRARDGLPLLALPFLWVVACGGLALRLGSSPDPR
jgi:hypothetical protein